MGRTDDVDRGTPGGSLFRTYEARRTARERRVRSRHPRLGGLLLALSGEPDTTVNFRCGAEAEVRIAERLRRRCGSDVELLFNRRLSTRGRDGDIDVLAVTPNGVHVVDVKRYAGKAVRVRSRGGLLLPLREQLLIGGRDHTQLLVSVARQRAVVRGLLDAVPDGQQVPLHVAMCFVDADLPLLPERIDGVALLGWKGVARRFAKAGPIGEEGRALLVRHLARHLPPA
jgi:Nuclease-related domain